MARRTIEEQIAAAHNRLARAQAREGYVYRARIPSSRIVEGARWCAGCQSVVPLWYTTGSRCRACASEAARASHVSHTYGITAAEERALLLWQGGRCFVCGKLSRTRRLAVDHDHETGEVRGLLCSNDKFGCNVLLRQVLADLPAATRLVAYVEQTPFQRMKAGDAPWQF